MPFCRKAEARILCIMVLDLFADRNKVGKSLRLMNILVLISSFKVKQQLAELTTLLSKLIGLLGSLLYLVLCFFFFSSQFAGNFYLFFLIEVFFLHRKIIQNSLPDGMCYFFLVMYDIEEHF